MPDIHPFVVVWGIIWVIVSLTFYLANTVIILMFFRHRSKESTLLSMIIATEVLFIVPIVPQIMACIVLFSPQSRNAWASLYASNADATSRIYVIFIIKLFISIGIWILVLRYKVFNRRPKPRASDYRSDGSGPEQSS